MDYQQILPKDLESTGYIKYKVQSCTVLLCCREEARKQWIDNMHSAMPLFCQFVFRLLPFMLSHLWLLENSMGSAGSRTVTLYFPKCRI